MSKKNKSKHSDKKKNK